MAKSELKCCLPVATSATCEKYAHPSKFKEWAQRLLEYSESETLMAVLQDWVPDKQRHRKWLQQALYCLVCKSLPWFLIGWVLWGLHSFPTSHLGCLLDYLKYATLGIGQILETSLSGIHLLCGRKVPVIWHVHGFYSFPYSVVIYCSQFKFPYQLTLPQCPQADSQASGQDQTRRPENGPSLILFLTPLNKLPFCPSPCLFIWHVGASG
jgi:hypothetical protein